MRLKHSLAAATRPEARGGHLAVPPSAARIPGSRPVPGRTAITSCTWTSSGHRMLRRGGSRFHCISKHVIGDWLRARYPEVHVVVDAEAIENRQVPDVLAEFQTAGASRSRSSAEHSTPKSGFGGTPGTSPSGSATCGCSATCRATCVIHAAAGEWTATSGRRSMTRSSGPVRPFTGSTPTSG